MYIKQERKIDLFERKGYLIYLISELPNMKGAEEREAHLAEIEKTIDDIVRTSVKLCMDYPDILEDLKLK